MNTNERDDPLITEITRCALERGYHLPAGPAGSPARNPEWSRWDPWICRAPIGQLAPVILNDGWVYRMVAIQLETVPQASPESPASMAEWIDRLLHATIRRTGRRLALENITQRIAVDIQVGQVRGEPGPHLGTGEVTLSTTIRLFEMAEELTQ